MVSACRGQRLGCRSDVELQHFPCCALLPSPGPARMGPAAPSSAQAIAVAGTCLRSCLLWWVVFIQHAAVAECSLLRFQPCTDHLYQDRSRVPTGGTTLSTPTSQLLLQQYTDHADNFTHVKESPTGRRRSESMPAHCAALTLPVPRRNADAPYDAARLDAAARFEAAAAALRRGEILPGLLSPAPTGPGSYPHTSLNTTSLPPRWRVPGTLDRSSGGSGSSGDGPRSAGDERGLFRSTSDEPGLGGEGAARAAAAAALAAGYLPPSVLPPAYGGLGFGAPFGGGPGGVYHPAGRLLTSSAPHANMADMVAEFAASEYAPAALALQRAAASAAAAAASSPMAQPPSSRGLFRALSSPSMPGGMSGERLGGKPALLRHLLTGCRAVLSTILCTCFGACSRHQRCPLPCIRSTNLQGPVPMTSAQYWCQY